MRLQLGEVARDEKPSPPPDGWQVIQSPALKAGYWLALLAGVGLLLGLCVGVSAWAWAVGDRGGTATAGESGHPWLSVTIVLLLFVPLHEFLHLLGQPAWGSTERSVVAVWPAELRFGVYYEGCMSRRRWLGMRLAPLVVLSILPACVLALLQLQAQSVDLEIGLQVMMTVNALGSGGDIVAALIVASQVPPDARLCFQAGKAYWCA